MKLPSPSQLKQTSARRGTAGAYFRDQIERAEAKGAARGDMLLRLTLSDVSQLKRDPNLALEDISFSEGVMRFLGVKVAQGGISDSVLDEDPVDEPVVEAPAKPVKKTRAKAKPKAEAKV